MATVNDKIAEGMEFLGQCVAGDPALGCMQCGMCSSSCPLGTAMQYPPRQLILQARSGNLDEIIKSPSLWMCVGCYNCSFRCPRGIELTEEVWPALRDRAMQLGIQPPTELQAALQNTFKYGNALGNSPRKRTDWANNLDVPLRDLSQEPSVVEVLWLVGDYPSYYPRNQVVSRDFARILTAMGVRWGILGRDEKTIGDCERLAGEEGLFESLIEDNIQVLSKHQYEKILVTDPHSLNSLQNIYPKRGHNYPVEHYAPFLAERLDQLKPLLAKPVEATVTYHDNCWLSRRCGCFDPPRQLLEAIPGVTLVEMRRNRENGLCCGGGGGGMWLDGHIVEQGGQRLSDERIREAASTGADVLAVSCPFELSRFEDSAKVTDLEGRLKVRDIIELLAESMDLREKETS
ncbi:MAG: (Fe-S)-binding protein [Pirellulales bacterium]|nr:(Fe-S)-binding protein [Pirellulales bacterium]